MFIYSNLIKNKYYALSIHECDIKVESLYFAARRCKNDTCNLELLFQM